MKPTFPRHPVTRVTNNEKAFLDALTDWAIHRWRPQERFYGEFDDAVISVEAMPGVNPELAATLDRALGKKRFGGRHRLATIQKLLDSLCRRGLLKQSKFGPREHWYDVHEPR